MADDASYTGESCRSYPTSWGGHHLGVRSYVWLATREAELIPGFPAKGLQPSSFVSKGLELHSEYMFEVFQMFQPKMF